MTDKLTDKQRMFCHEYMKDLNGTQAAIRAGYSENSAKEIASQNLTKDAVSEYLKSLMDDRIKQVDIDVNDILTDIINTRLECAADKKYSERLKANELLGKYKKMWTDKTELTGSDGKPIETTSEVRITFVDSKPTDSESV
jgi:phage terminase small subunit